MIDCGAIRNQSVIRNPQSAMADINDLRRWAHLLDTTFRIPGTRIRFGWDPIIGLIPGLGDLATPVFSGMILLHGFRRGIPKVVQLRMLFNVILDAAVGLVPLLGDLWDFAWKANAKNLALLERHAHAPVPATRGDWIFVGAILGLTVLVALVPLAVIVWIVWRFGAV